MEPADYVSRSRHRERRGGLDALVCAATRLGLPGRLRKERTHQRVKVFAAALRAGWQAFAMLADRQRNCYRTSAIVAVVLVYRHYMSPYGFDTG